MRSRYDFAFPQLYGRWREHDLNRALFPGYARPWSYEGPEPDSEPEVWRFIEENYLLKYERFLAVRFDWSSSGLWSIPFPGSVLYGTMIGGLEEMGISAQARVLLKEWHDALDARPDYGEGPGGDDFDYEASDARGLAAAKEIRKTLGSDIYLEFHEFGEISMAGGEAVELEVPARLLEISGARP